MKTAAVFTAILATAAAFAPAQQKQTSFALAAEKTPFFESIFGMDLFAPNPTVNTYGSRDKKGLKVGKIAPGKSYVPAGLSATDYQKVRDSDQAKKNASYSKAKSKAGKFLDYTKFYTQRGTDTSDAWFKSAGRGHTFAKTKYDFSGGKNEQKNYDGSA
uniref:Uncharacterized protein n=1 Tax=Grammatophora oceanica TaxID=210454 RepID=A0A7S1YHB9_9STRA|mmetsp:Transcript_47003/g.69905  ORF Transcript_47003/g.69905 Transcript_47003/m.69905 type:complete len:159 (+) Transcript_47003:97-573(+)|eukprot:CAMPEP_0194028042 /NCGR_PEP_ID=MMETSP0009_2-20130614/2066_1 /TAXON_ID=210454 /ORGANISM="Grammatophora oceanica, Strain CCMP 410" /LENGTH=158 /DNA_ID=CAMNT_0038667291 /DNA_START=88 /DNA_END=564 /DNA_ORIENTATION=+